MSRRTRFEIVEGTVSSVTRTKSGVYLGFGSDWKTDFTARIARDVLSVHPDLDQMLSGISGKQIAVRGWIERRNGPMIDVRDPSQLDVRQAPATIPPAISGLTAPGAAEPASTPPVGDVPNPSDKAPNDDRPAIPKEKSPGDVDL